MSDALRIELPVSDTTFGGMLEIDTDCDLIVLCVNSGSGYKPIHVLLPHQVYVEDLKKLFAKYPDTRQFSVLCVKNAINLTNWVNYPKSLEKPPKGVTYAAHDQ